MTGMLPSTRTWAGGAYVTQKRETELGTRGCHDCRCRGRVLPTCVRSGDRTRRRAPTQSRRTRSSEPAPDADVAVVRHISTSVRPARRAPGGHDPYRGRPGDDARPCALATAPGRSGFECVGPD